MKDLPTGVITALVTPFKNQTLDEDAFRNLVQLQIQNQIDGIVIAGTTGESPTLSTKEIQKLVQISQGFSSCPPIILGVGGNSTEKVIENCMMASDLGVEAVMAVTPYYNKPPQWCLLKHFEKIAQSSRLPILLYNVPGRTSCDLLPETILKLEEFDTIAGVKEASGNIERISQLKSQKLKENFRIFTGDDPLYVPALERGADGVVSVISNCFPEPWKKIDLDFKQGNHESASHKFKQWLPLTQQLFQVTNPIGIKYVAHALGRMRNELRLPLLSLHEAPPREEQAFSKILQLIPRS